mmetsp:Transcript_77824/g.228140  ORF Transcript_77824/g.228140 Transcript_77824/m.228140 type:complete len:208 (+) Transcript_77824:270-893(+)
MVLRPAAPLAAPAAHALGHRQGDAPALRALGRQLPGQGVEALAEPVQAVLGDVPAVRGQGYEVLLHRGPWPDPAGAHGRVGRELRVEVDHAAVHGDVAWHVPRLVPRPLQLHVGSREAAEDFGGEALRLASADAVAGVDQVVLCRLQEVPILHEQLALLHGRPRGTPRAPILRQRRPHGAPRAPLLSLSVASLRALVLLHRRPCRAP